MAMTNAEQPVLSLDLKKGRIRVHKQTLHALGDPPFIQLLFSARRKAIVILKRDMRLPNGQEIAVTFDKPTSAGCFDLYSRELLSRIRSQFSGLDRQGLYHLTGYASLQDGAVVFPLDTLMRQEAPHA